MKLLEMKNLKPLIVVIVGLVILIATYFILPKTAVSDITTGLVGYWNFDEGSGTMAADSSGNGNTGTLVGSPIWTTGQVGGALSFDGVDDYVEAPDSNSLDLPNQVTLCAWVKSSSTSRMSVVNKTYNDYEMGMENTKVQVWYGNSAGWQSLSWTNPSTLADGNWHHLVVFIDKANGTGEAWVGGNSLGTQTASSSTGNYNQPLRIGARSATSNRFNGVIDEVRIYNRALSTSEITELYNYTGADTIPPSVPTGLTATAVSSSQINLSWTASTDNVGVTGYKIYRNGSYLVSTANTSYSDTGLSPSTTYTYRVSAYDVAGNESAQSTQASATTQAAADITPPTISSVASSTTTTSATITWITNENSDSQVEYGLTTSYGSQTALDPTLVTSHLVLVSGLSPSTLYHYRVKSKDAAGNLATSGDYTFTTRTSTDVTVGLVGYWKLDDGTGTIAVDSSCRMNDGTLVNGPIWTTGQINGALSFDGVNDYVRVPDSPSLNNSEISITAWINPSQTAGAIARKWEWADRSGFHFDIDSNRLYVKIGYGDGTVRELYTSFGSSYFNTFTHVAFTASNTAIILYINGVNIASATPAKSIDLTNIKEVVIGGGSGWSGLYFKGVIDEVRVYNRVLSPSEISRVYNYTPIVSGNNVSGWGWSETIGWISFNCADFNCTNSNYGVSLDPNTKKFLGYAWSDIIGWIKFDPIGPYPAAPSYSATHNSANNEVNGWIRACAVFQSGCDGALRPSSELNGWDGWILLGNETNTLWTNQVKINPATKEFEGWAWGGEIVGWISFNCKDPNICGI